MQWISRIAMVVMVMFVAACSKDQTTTNSKIYKGVVWHNMCCQDVVEVVSSDSMGQDTWIDSNTVTLTVRHHVFRVGNPCQFGSHAMGDTISFRMVVSSTQTCACCMAFVHTPHVSYSIAEVK